MSATAEGKKKGNEQAKDRQVMLFFFVPRKLSSKTTNLGPKTLEKTCQS